MADMPRWLEIVGGIAWVCSLVLFAFAIREMLGIGRYLRALREQEQRAAAAAPPSSGEFPICVARRGECG